MEIVKPTDVEAGIYKAYLDDLGRLGGRHETLRAFYLTALSALMTIIGFVGPTGASGDSSARAKMSLAAVGCLLALIWSTHMRSFSVYFQAKKQTLEKLEKGWAIAPFTEERSQLPSGRFYRVTYADQLVAVGFFLLFLALAMQWL